jgi:hypothetical protein
VLSDGVVRDGWDSWSFCCSFVVEQVLGWVVPLGVLRAFLHAWAGKAKVARFIDFVLQVAPETLNQVIAHRSFPDAFGNRRSQTKFLDEIYSRRSRPLHSGFLQHNVEGFFGGMSGAAMRVALLSGLARDCIANFLFAPVSMLTGHPQCDPQNIGSLKPAGWPAVWLGGVAMIKPP